MSEHTRDAVTFWYDEHGVGDPLVYLHGGFSDSREIDEHLDRLAAVRRVLRIDRRGHGRTADTDGPYGYAQNAADVVGFVEDVVGGPVDLVGFSDGATTALHVALARPELVGRLVLMSGQFHRDGLLPEMLGGDPEATADALARSPLAERYAEVSPDGADHFRVVARKVAQLALDEPTLAVPDLAGVGARTLVLAADDDALSLEHTIAMYRGIADAELAVVPGASHVHIVDKPHLVLDLVVTFLTQGPVETRAPIRRAR